MSLSRISLTLSLSPLDGARDDPEALEGSTGEPLVWKDEQQTGGVADACGVEADGPLAARDWGESGLRGRAGQLTLKSGFEPCDGVGKRHCTIVICAHVACGAG